MESKVLNNSDASGTGTMPVSRGRRWQFAFNFLICIFLLSICFLPSMLVAATLRTLQGKAYDGTVSFDPRGYFLVLPKSGPPARVDPGDLLELTYSTESPVMAHGLFLTDGTQLAADIGNIDDTTAHYTRAGVQGSIPLSQVARVAFASVAQSKWDKIGAGRTGALLAAGDFFEGEFKYLRGKQLLISSVLFGPTTFDVNQQVAGVVLADVQPISANWVVRLADGSLLPASSIALDNGGLTVTGSMLGTTTIGSKEVLEIRCGSQRLRSMADIQPDKTDGGQPMLDATPPGVPTDLLGLHLQHCIGMSAGISATYSLDGNYRVFTCRAGVPIGFVPMARVRFIVLVDDRELFRSPDRQCIDDPLTIAVPLDGAKSFTLKVESNLSGDVGAFGVWGDAALVKN